MPPMARRAGCTAAVGTTLELTPGRRYRGLLAIPRGYEIQVRPRSGLAIRHGVTVANTPGTIDGDYRGAKVLLINLGQESFTINRGDRIAQMVVAVVTKQASPPSISLMPERGAGGFGSTGGIS